MQRITIGPRGQIRFTENYLAACGGPIVAIEAAPAAPTTPPAVTFDDPRAISQILKDHGYSHRKCTAKGAIYDHDILDRNGVTVATLGAERVVDWLNGQLKRHRFTVTFEIVTPESAEDGEAEEMGTISEKVRLRDAIDDVRATRTSKCDGVSFIEPSESGPDFRWVTIGNGMEFETGARESRSIHIPDNVTPSSRARILRLLSA